MIYALQMGNSFTYSLHAFNFTYHTAFCLSAILLDTWFILLQSPRSFRSTPLLRDLRLDRVAGHNVRPSDQSPVFLDPPAQCDLLADRGAGRCRQSEFGCVGFDAHDLCARSCGPAVDHQNFILGEFGDFVLFSVGSLDA